MQLAFNLFDPKRGKLERAFWQFHDQHPEVYGVMLEAAREWRAQHGPKARLGAKKLFEQVRWELHLRLGDEVPRLNNNHTAFYARLLMRQHPELAGLFQLRQQRVACSFGPDNNGLPPNRHISP
jgi:hypothetical protein